MDIVAVDAGQRLRDPGALTRVSLLLNNEVVPKLRNLLGRDLVLPRRVRLFDDLNADGDVPTGVEADGTIERVDDPRLRVADDARLGYVACHELAHFHDLSVRRARGASLPSFTSTVLWSEYFAERTAHAAGFLNPALAEAAGLPVPAPPQALVMAPDPEGEGVRVSSSRGYARALVLAQHDALPQLVWDTLPGFHWLLQAMRSQNTADRMYGKFPSWSLEDRYVLRGFFDLLDEFPDRSDADGDDCVGRRRTAGRRRPRR